MRKLIRLTILLVIICSCEKYLSTKPNNNVTTPSSVADLQALLDESGTMNSTSSCFDQASADEYFLTPANYAEAGNDGQLAYVWNLRMYVWPNDWANAYNIVYNANLCLENIQSVDRTTGNAAGWDNVKGSALLYRGMSFLKLAWLFSKAWDSETSSTDAGIALRMGTDFNVPSVRASVQETYNQIINDLEEAIPLLPDHVQSPVRPSKGAAYGFLARTFLSMRLYDSAYQYADLALALNKNLMDYNNADSTLRNPFQAFNEEVIFHTDITNFTIATFYPGDCAIDSTVVNSYGRNDLRKPDFLAFGDNGYAIFKGSYGTHLFTGIATDEMLLTRAECAVRKGDVENALEDLNILLQKRYKTGTYEEITGSDPQSLLLKILMERRKELLFRGLRWMDIKRLNKEGFNITLIRSISGRTYQLPPNDNRYALPLPDDIIKAGSMQQNPG